MADHRELEARLRAALRTPTPLPDPEGSWRRIQQRLAAPAMPRRVRPVSPLFATAAGLAAVIVGAYVGVLWQYASPSQWRVVTVGPSQGPSTLGVGEWLETGPGDKLRLNVGRIGSADVGPESRLRREPGAWNAHRLELQRGSVDVVITAPPRLFFVKTPTAMATDLGCAYRLEVGEDGGSALHVTAGWVELAEAGRRSLVPAGMSALVGSDGVPGTPFVPTMDRAAQEALGRLDRGTAHAGDLPAVLAALPAPGAAVVTRQLYGITLWHLIERVAAPDRTVLVDALWRLAPPPPAVTREGIATLDRRMLDAWRRSLYPMWEEESVPILVALSRRFLLWALD